MNNSDMPAMPLTGDAYQDFAGYDGTRRTSYNPECQGLTKREYFAGLAFNGLISDTATTFASVQEGEAPAKRIAKMSVNLADALLKELEK